MKKPSTRHKSNRFTFCFLNGLLLAGMMVSRVACLRVENLKESSRDVSSITIEWSVNDEDSTMLAKTSGDDEWIGFKIKYFTSKLQFAPVLLKNANLRKFRLDNLKSNTEYKIQVSAFNKLENEGPASNLLSVKTLESGK